MEENTNKIIEIDKSFIKITINQSQIFNQFKNILPYTLYLQLENYPEQKIMTIKDINQTFESPSNEYIFDLNLTEKDKKEDLVNYILTFEAYTTSVFFITKKFASIQIPIFLKKFNIGKQWYILKDNNNESCIKILINIEINIPNDLRNLINKSFFSKIKNSFSNQTNDLSVRKTNEQTINTNKIYNNIINSNNNNHIHNYNSNCYTHLSTNIHSLNSISLIKRNSQSNNSLLINNKSSPILLNNNLSNNYSNISYIILDKEKDKDKDEEQINTNSNYICELEIPFEEKYDNNNYELEEKLNKIKNLINIKQEELDKKSKKINSQKNEIIFLAKYNLKKRELEKDLLELEKNERKLEKEKQIYENKNIDLNEKIHLQNKNNYKNQLLNDLNIYENNIFNNINNLILNNNNNDELLLKSKMNDLFTKSKNTNNIININYKINNNAITTLRQYLLNTKNKKTKKNSFNNKNMTENKNELSIPNNFKKYIKKNNTKKNSILNNNINYKNKNKNIKNFNYKNSFNNINEIKSEKVLNYSTNRIRIKKEKNILHYNYNRESLKTIFKSYTNNNLNATSNNLSLLNKNSVVNLFFKRKIDSNNFSVLQKNHSLAEINTSKNKNKQTKYYISSYKANNKKIKKYPIKINYFNDSNSLSNNKINITETSIPIKYKKNKILNSYKTEGKKNINEKRNTNYLINKPNIQNEKKKSFYNEKNSNKKNKNKDKNTDKDKFNSTSVDKENIQNNIINKNNTKQKKVGKIQKNINYRIKNIFIC